MPHPIPPLANSTHPLLPPPPVPIFNLDISQDIPMYLYISPWHMFISDTLWHNIFNIFLSLEIIYGNDIQVVNILCVLPVKMLIFTMHNNYICMTTNCNSTRFLRGVAHNYTCTINTKNISHI